jgi:antitoxin (DNA-binding transcriptional repressor) of toxin-antitoxin stability system
METSVKTIGVREFRDQATTVLASGETLVVERHGEPIGFYVPIVAVDRAAGRDALGRLANVLAEIEQRTGITEDELAEGLTIRRRRSRR